MKPFKQTCLLCRNIKSYEVDINNFFNINKETDILCKDCNKKLYYQEVFEVIPLDGKVCYLYYLLDMSMDINQDVYLNLNKKAFFHSLEEKIPLIYLPLFHVSFLKVLEKIMNKSFILIAYIKED